LTVLSREAVIEGIIPGLGAVLVVVLGRLCFPAEVLRGGIFLLRSRAQWPIRPERYIPTDGAAVQKVGVSPTLLRCHIISLTYTS
jgi:hypothetical protein